MAGPAATPSARDLVLTVHNLHTVGGGTVTGWYVASFADRDTHLAEYTSSGVNVERSRIVGLAALDQAGSCEHLQDVLTSTASAETREPTIQALRRTIRDVQSCRASTPVTAPGQKPRSSHGAPRTASPKATHAEFGTRSRTSWPYGCSWADPEPTAWPDRDRHPQAGLARYAGVPLNGLM